jgi:hypothetical protein
MAMTAAAPGGAAAVSFFDPAFRIPELGDGDNP